MSTLTYEYEVVVGRTADTEDRRTIDVVGHAALRGWRRLWASRWTRLLGPILLFSIACGQASNLSEMIGVAGLAQDEQLRTLFITRAGNRVEDDLTASLDDKTATLYRV